MSVSKYRLQRLENKENVKNPSWLTLVDEKIRPTATRLWEKIYKDIAIDEDLMVTYQDNRRGSSIISLLNAVLNPNWDEVGVDIFNFVDLLFKHGLDSVIKPEIRDAYLDKKNNEVEPAEPKVELKEPKEPKVESKAGKIKNEKVKKPRKKRKPIEPFPPLWSSPDIFVVDVF